MKLYGVYSKTTGKLQRTWHGDPMLYKLRRTAWENSGDQDRIERVTVTVEREEP